jgi:hypothetical protein
MMFTCAPLLAGRQSDHGLHQSDKGKAAKYLRSRGAYKDRHSARDTLWPIQPRAVVHRLRTASDIYYPLSRAVGMDKPVDGLKALKVLSATV